MRKIHRESSQTLRDYWGIGTIPFDLVRLIVDKPKAEQTWLVLRYLEISTGNNKKERSKARAATLKAIKENSYAQTSQGRSTRPRPLALGATQAQGYSLIPAYREG